MKRNMMNQLFVAAATTATLVAGSAWADGDGDGLPHVAIAEEESGEIVLEFAIELGLDESTTPPTINLAAPVYDNFLGGYSTEPLAPSLPNSDLGFVSEVEGSGVEGGTINADIVVRMLTKDANFKAFFSGSEIFTNGSPDFALGSAFDTHPAWVLANTEGDLTPATASFEVFDITNGAIGNGAESIGQFDVALTVPEPTSALALLAGAGLIAVRRRRRA